MRRLLILALCLTLPLLVLAGDWPRFLGPQANGISLETGINKDWKAKAPQTLWRVPMSDKGYAGPSVANGIVYIVDHEGTNDVVKALKLATGEEVWRFAYEENIGHNFGFCRTTPTFDNGNLYTLSRQGMLHCFEAATGKVVWSKQIVKEFGGRLPGWQLAISPVIDGDKLIVCPGGANAHVVALNKKNGELIWKGGGSDPISYATPVIATIDGVKQYVLFTAYNLTGVKAEDGSVLWAYPWRTGSDVNAAAPLVAGNQIFITSSYGHGCAVVKVENNVASKVWENKEMAAHFSTPIFFDGYIYGTTDTGGALLCLDPRTGAAMWKQPGFEKGGVCMVDGVILALAGNSGELAMVKPDSTGYQELGRIKPLGGQSWTAPIVADGKLIIRNTTALACVELK